MGTVAGTARRCPAAGDRSRRPGRPALRQTAAGPRTAATAAPAAGPAAERVGSAAESAGAAAAERGRSAAVAEAAAAGSGATEEALAAWRTGTPKTRTDWLECASRLLASHYVDQRAYEFRRV